MKFFSFFQTCSHGDDSLVCWLIGSHTRNVVLPGWLSKSIFPWCLSRIFLQISKPSPLPSPVGFAWRITSSCENTRNWSASISVPTNNDNEYEKGTHWRREAAVFFARNWAASIKSEEWNNACLGVIILEKSWHKFSKIDACCKRVFISKITQENNARPLVSGRKRQQRAQNDSVQFIHLFSPSKKNPAV